jgi:hypothetical protein
MSTHEAAAAAATTTTAVITKVAHTVQYAGATGAASAGGAYVFGYTPAEWSVIGVIGGLAFAALGFVVGTITNIFYKQKHYKLAQAAMRALPSNALKVADDD